MRIRSFRLRGVRCFPDTGDIVLSPGCNIFVGQNNAGKSTLLRGITSWQINPFVRERDVRPDVTASGYNIILEDIYGVQLNYSNGRSIQTFVRDLKGNPNWDEYGDVNNRNSDSIFNNTWPNNFILPYSAKRKANSYGHSVDKSTQGNVDGTFSNLYAKVDRVAAPGPSAHNYYRQAVTEILGVFIGTQSSSQGKQAGYYYSEDDFIPLDQMGDGVAEIVALVVDLSLSKGKVFVLEEPETNLHPRGLKALLALVRESAKHNQFVIATHSNIVVRELGSESNSKVFRVYRDGQGADSPSVVEAVPNAPAEHMALLTELGYEFGDFHLHDAWLFLEEASAETVMREVLIPWFVPELIGRLRTFSAAGVDNLEPTIAEFQRLVTFVHLSPIYRDRLWVRADGDEPGRKIIANLQEKFPYLASPRADIFTRPQFEQFYPERFQEKSTEVLAIVDKRQKREAKRALLSAVLEWTRQYEDEARVEWAVSCREQVALLREIQEQILEGFSGRRV